MQGNAKPFVKWVGGKSQLLPQLEMLLPKDLASRENLTYVEPCVGGGAMLYFMLKKFRNIKRVLINDLNERLVTTYKVVRDHPKDLIAALHDIQTEYYACSCESERCDVYFRCRERFNGGIFCKNGKAGNLLPAQPRLWYLCAQCRLGLRLCRWTLVLQGHGYSRLLAGNRHEGGVSLRSPKNE